MSKAETINKLFGQRLAMARRVRKISQSELGRRLNRSRVTIANIENGRHGVQLSQVFHLADALNASVDELIPERKAIFSFEASSADAFVEFAKARLNDLKGLPR
jgi:repressor LexA